MPTETFFRLSEPKQQRIIEAIKLEVARVPYEEISINSIIRQCGISRGSFYQYFENKEDMYLYLISGYYNRIFSYASASLQKHRGDFFAMLEDTFRFAVRMLCYKESKAFRRNLFCNMKLYEAIIQNREFRPETTEQFESFLNGIDTSLLTVSSRDELLNFIGICIPAVLRDMACVFMDDASEQAVCERFDKKLVLLKEAFSPAKEEL